MRYGLNRHRPSIRKFWMCHAGVRLPQVKRNADFIIGAVLIDDNRLFDGAKDLSFPPIPSIPRKSPTTVLMRHVSHGLVTCGAVRNAPCFMPSCFKARLRGWLRDISAIAHFCPPWKSIDGCSRGD